MKSHKSVKKWRTRRGGSLRAYRLAALKIAKLNEMYLFPPTAAGWGARTLYAGEQTSVSCPLKPIKSCIWPLIPSLMLMPRKSLRRPTDGRGEAGVGMAGKH